MQYAQYMLTQVK